MKPLLISLISFLFSFLIFSTCSEENEIVVPEQSKITELSKKPKQPKEWPKEIYDSTYGKITLVDTSLMTIMALPCGTKVTHGHGLERFEPMPGKLVGYWLIDYSVSNLTLLRTKFGYSGIFAMDGTHYMNAINAGYNKSNIMLSVSFDWPTENYKQIVSSYDAGYYYIDEAVEHGCFENIRRMYSPTELYNVRNYIHSNRPNSKFTISGYKRCGHFLQAGYYADVVMYSEYDNWYLPWWMPATCNSNLNWGSIWEVPWFEGSIDQRESWSDMKNKFGNKFSRTWINTYEVTEYDYLFGHAKNLGLNSVWVYGYYKDGAPVPHFDNYQGVAEAAFNQGFMRKFVRDYRIEWRCTGGCDCDPSDPEAGWYIYEVFPTSYIHEIFP